MYIHVRTPSHTHLVMNYARLLLDFFSESESILLGCYFCFFFLLSFPGSFSIGGLPKFWYFAFSERKDTYAYSNLKEASQICQNHGHYLVPRLETCWFGFAFPFVFPTLNGWFRCDNRLSGPSISSPLFHYYVLWCSGKTIIHNVGWQLEQASAFRVVMGRFLQGFRVRVESFGRHWYPLRCVVWSHSLQNRSFCSSPTSHNHSIDVCQ